MRFKRIHLNNKKQALPRRRTMRAFAIVASVASTFAIVPCVLAAQTSGVPEPPSGVPERQPVDSHMSEALRAPINTVVVVGGESAANQAVTGSYARETAGLIGGMESGSRMGRISKEIGGVPINIPIPGLAIPGAIFGALSGATKRQIQEFRDALTEEIASSDSPPLRSDGLALDAFWSVRRQPNIQSQLFAPSVEIPADTDAVLYVRINDLTIDVQGKEAIITTSAVATLRQPGDNRNAYETTIAYQDRDTLSRWTENDNALWRNYTNFARYYLGRAVSADVFSKVDLNHELIPVETDTAERARKDKRKFVSESLTPTLAWNLNLSGGDDYGTWTESLDESRISYDIEIFDDRQLVYDEKQVPDPEHTVSFELEPCQTYRWSVRPVYQVGDGVRFGEWMHFDSPPTDKKKSTTNQKNEYTKGVFGRRVSEAPAYTQDFALLEIECGRR